MLGPDLQLVFAAQNIKADSVEIRQLNSLIIACECHECNLYRRATLNRAGEQWVGFSLVMLLDHVIATFISSQSIPQRTRKDITA